jgi:cyclase
MREYLAYVRSEAGRLLAQGLSVVEASKRIDLGPYAGWTEPERIVFQVERAARELRGVAYDAPLDVNVLFAGMYEVRRAMDARHVH